MRYLLLKQRYRSASFCVKALDPAKVIKAINVQTQRPAPRIIDEMEVLTDSTDRDHCPQYIFAGVTLKGALSRLMITILPGLRTIE